MCVQSSSECVLTCLPYDVLKNSLLAATRLQVPHHLSPYNCTFFIYQISNMFTTIDGSEFLFVGESVLAASKGQTDAHAAYHPRPPFPHLPFSYPLCIQRLC